MSTHTNSPDHTPIQPLHNPSLAAQVVVSQALIDNDDIALAKKGNPAFSSPTDNLLTPCTKRLGAARRKHFHKPPKSQKTVQLFPQAENSDSNEEDEEQVAVPIEKKMEDDDENPFKIK